MRRFQFRLAMGLGKTLSEIEHISREELIGWIAFYSFEPWGCPVEDHRTELNLNLLYAINSKPNSRIPRFIDRDPQGRTSEEQTEEELEQSIIDFFAGRTIKVEPQAELPAPDKKQRKPRKPRKPPTK